MSAASSRPGDENFPWITEKSIINRSILLDLAWVAAQHGISTEYDGEQIFSPVTTGKPAASPPVNQPAVPEASPPGVHLAPQVRVGDEARDRYLGHLQEMLAKGFLDEREYDARMPLALKAQTMKELEVLVSDLPRLAEKIEVKPAAREKKGWIIPALSSMQAGMAVSALVLLPLDGLMTAFFICLAVFHAVLTVCYIAIRK